MIRVLVVDDWPSTREGIKAMLGSSPNIQVTGEASGGQEAVQVAAEEQPDVVLMDVRMPVMDGLEAARLIKDGWPQIKVILLSMEPPSREEMLASGADRFLLKGDRTKSLEDVILSSFTQDTQQL
jgi:two-component system nitrate/nitrite response regulator NarL